MPCRAVAPPLGAGEGGVGRRCRSAAGAGGKSGLQGDGGRHDAVNTRVNPSHARREKPQPRGLDPAAGCPRAPPLFPRGEGEGGRSAGRSPPPGARGGGRGKERERARGAVAAALSRRRGAGRGSPPRPFPGGRVPAARGAAPRARGGGWSLPWDSGAEVAAGRRPPRSSRLMFV